MEFKDIGVNEALCKGLLRQGIKTPTNIQEKLIPELLTNKDIIARSNTGTGKTLAYLVPIFSKIDTQIKSTQAIILVPTHELASQVAKQAETLSKNSGLEIHSALIIGSSNISRQIEKLKEKPQIVIGSCGRIFELIKKKKIAAHTVKTIVIDEADRLLDNFNINAVKDIIKTTLKERQLVFTSASFSEEALKTARELSKETVEISAEQNESMPKSIEHFYIICERREKIEILRKIIHGEHIKKAIVFINNPNSIDNMVTKLNYHKLKAYGIHGEAFQEERKKAIDNFKSGKIQILVSSDISARGLDIEGVTHIINIDIPEEPVYYLHRAGRTGRMGAYGRVISIITPPERKFIKKFEKTLSTPFIQREMRFGKLCSIKNNLKNESYKTSKMTKINNTTEKNSKKI